MAFKLTKSKASTSTSNGPIRLRKEINLLQGISIIVGIIIGSGIFVSPVGVLRNVKSVGLSMVIWTVCGVFNMLGALCYAELGVTIPRSGGEYAYIKEAFGELAGFLCLWISFAVICCVANAASSLIFATYILKPIFPYCVPPILPVRLIAATAFILLVGINCFNVKWGTKIQVVFTASKLLAILIIVIIGFIEIIKGNTINLQNSFEGSDYSAGALAISFYSGFWAFGGWNYLNFLVDELKSPTRTLPRAIVISMSIVTAAYLLANVAYMTVLTPAEILESEAVAVTFAARTMGVMRWCMPLFVACSVIGSINGNTLSISRIFFVGAEDGQFPVFLSFIHYKWLTPAPALIMVGIMTLIMQNSNDIFYLIELMGLGVCVIMAATIASLLYLRVKRPDMERPIKLPIAIPLVLFLATIALLILTIYQKPVESGIAIALMAFGVPVYWFGVVWKKKPAALVNFSRDLTRMVQKILLVVPQDKKTT